MPRGQNLATHSECTTAIRGSNVIVAINILTPHWCSAGPIRLTVVSTQAAFLVYNLFWLTFDTFFPRNTCCVLNQDQILNELVQSDNTRH